MSSRVSSFLVDHSVVLYIYPCVPSLILLLLALVSATVLHAGKSAFDSCEPSSRLLQVYLLGHISASYIGLVAYANVLMELVPWAKSAAFWMWLNVCALGFGVAWSVLGAVALAKAHCKEAYYWMTIIDVVCMFCLVAWGSISLFYFCAKRTIPSVASLNSASLFHENPEIAQPPNVSSNPVQAFAVLKIEESHKRSNEVVIENIP